MRTTITPRSKFHTDSFEDLNDESFQSIQWNPGILRKALPKDGPKIKKMKTR